MVRFLTKPFSPVCLKHKVFTAVNPWKLSRTGTSFNAQHVREPARSSQEFTSVWAGLQSRPHAKPTHNRIRFRDAITRHTTQRPKHITFLSTT